MICLGIGIILYRLTCYNKVSRKMTKRADGRKADLTLTSSWALIEVFMGVCGCFVHWQRSSPAVGLGN